MKFGLEFLQNFLKNLTCNFLVIIFLQKSYITKNYNLDIILIGYPVRLALKCFNSKHEESLLLKAITLQEMVKRGIFMSLGPTFISYSHSIQDIELTLTKFEEVCKLINNSSENNYKTLLEGNLPKTIYSYNIKSTKNHCKYLFNF